VPIISNSFNFETLKGQYNGDVFPLFLANGKEELLIYTVDSDLVPSVGQALVVLVPPVERAESWASEEYDHAALQPGQFMGSG
jgi:hypothetical protein